MVEIIMVPGIGGSGELHWQTRWEDANPQCHRLQPSDWDQPVLDDWIAALDRAVGAARQAPLLVAHSLGCLLVAHWQQVSTAPVAGAFLVAVPNPEARPSPSRPPVLPIRPGRNSGFPRSSSRARTTPMARSNMPERERTNGEAVSSRLENSDTSTRRASLRTGRRERPCSRLSPPEPRADGEAVPANASTSPSDRIEISRPSPRADEAGCALGIARLVLRPGRPLAQRQ